MARFGVWQLLEADSPRCVGWQARRRRELVWDSADMCVVPILPEPLCLEEMLTPCGNVTAQPALPRVRSCRAVCRSRIHWQLASCPRAPCSGDSFSVIFPLAGAVVATDQEHVLLAGCGGSPVRLVAPPHLSKRPKALVLLLPGLCLCMSPHCTLN